MARVVCEVRPGLASFVRFVIVTGADGRRESLQVDADFLAHENGTALLPVGVVYQDKDRALIEFPTMADSGTYRLWAPISALR